MEQFIFDVLKMYIEFILYNWDSIRITYLIILGLFVTLSMVIFNKLDDSNRLNDNDGKFIFIMFSIFIILPFLLPSPETLQALIK